MLWLAVLAIAGIAAALLLPPLTLWDSGPRAPEPELTAENARGVCMELSETPRNISPAKNGIAAARVVPRAATSPLRSRLMI
jgi:hypothetical protein